MTPGAARGHSCFIPRFVLPLTGVWHNGGVKLLRILALSAVLLVAVGGLGKLAFTASNSVAASSVGSSSAAITAATLQPALCASNGVAPTSVRRATSATASFTGTTGADLIVSAIRATSSITLNGGGGKDCIVAGAVNSGRRITMSPTSGSGSVCIKGPGPGTYTYGAGCAVQG